MADIAQDAAGRGTALIFLGGVTGGSTAGEASAFKSGADGRRIFVGVSLAERFDSSSRAVAGLVALDGLDVASFADGGLVGLGVMTIASKICGGSVTTGAGAGDSTSAVSVDMGLCAGRSLKI